MISGTSHVALAADIDDSVFDGRTTTSLGLIVTELVINSLKHAFPDVNQPGSISVHFRGTPTGWKLSVEDNGIGYPETAARKKPGLGTGIIEALASQLDGQITISSKHPGTSVTVTHG